MSKSVKTSPTASLARVITSLPATRNMHPTTVRTEARVVRTGLRMFGGAHRPARKPDLKHDPKKCSPVFREDHA